MSQKSGTLNFLIRDANGQPQMVKVVKGAGTQSVGPIKLKQNPLKIIKLATSPDGTLSATTQKAPIYQALKFAGISCGTKLVQVPVGQISQLPQAQLITPKSEPPEYQEPVEVRLIHQQVQEFEVQAIPSTSPVKSPSVTSPVTVTSGSSAQNKPPPRLAATMSHATRRRHEDVSPQAYTTKRRKHADKVGKGLRHFSMKVCEKVRTKVLTTYNEVADELVLEFSSGIHGGAPTTDSQQYDHKNIRRRVYDALNVLMAMNIISKEKKEIRWLGLPSNSVQECTSLEKEKQARLEQIQKKTQQLNELILQHISFKSLIERNKESENRGVKPSPSSAIHLPFIVVNTSDKALIDCSISNDKTEYMFNFNKRFQIHDDIDILKRMGLLFGLDKGECSEEDIEKAKGMVPKSLEPYVEQMGRGVITKLTAMLEQAEEVEFEVPLIPEEGEEETADADEPEEEGDGDDDPDGEGEGAYSDGDNDSEVDV